MRFFSYRNKLRLKRLAVILGAVAAVALAFCAIRFIYLQRYLVFTDTGAVFDYDQSLTSQGDTHTSLNLEDFPIEYAGLEQSQAVSSQEQPLEVLSGYYITTSMLQDPAAVTAALEAAETAPKAVMVEMKSIYGNFYYASSLAGANTASVDISAVEALIDRLAQDKTYLIARIPAFSDNNFALANQSCGLPLSSGALWMDTNGCYWLDPQDAAVQDYLVAIAAELADLGFDEVVFDQYQIPDSENIVYEGDRTEAAAASAQTVKDMLEGYAIRVSFGSTAAGVAAVSDRLYISNDNGAAVEGIVANLTESLTDPAAQIVFCTASRDTRFEGYGLLRPLIEQSSEEQ